MNWNDEINSAAYIYRQEYNTLPKDYPTYPAEKGFRNGAQWAFGQGEVHICRAWRINGKSKIELTLDEELEDGQEVIIQIRKK